MVDFGSTSIVFRRDDEDGDDDRRDDEDGDDVRRDDEDGDGEPGFDDDDDVELFKGAEPRAKLWRLGLLSDDLASPSPGDIGEKEKDDGPPPALAEPRDDSRGRIGEGDERDNILKEERGHLPKRTAATGQTVSDRGAVCAGSSKFRRTVATADLETNPKICIFRRVWR